MSVLTSDLVFLRSVRRLLVTASVVPNSMILVTLMMEALSSSETSGLTRATRCNIPEVGILHVIGLHLGIQTVEVDRWPYKHPALVHIGALSVSVDDES
jgi:uncharacterized membrane protein YoaT (DUF817 family)